jgi:hypothetical protein
LNGELAIEELDDEELLHGRLKDSQGRLSAKGVNMVPRRLHEAMSRELVKRMNGKFAEHVDEAIEVILDVMRNGEGEQYSQFERAGTKRLQAAIYVVERIMGKPESNMHVTVEATPWQQAIEAGDLLVDVDQQPILDVEVVDDLPTTRASAPARTPVRRRRPRAEQPGTED